jgi:hypothetical protein
MTCYSLSRSSQHHWFDWFPSTGSGDSSPATGVGHAKTTSATAHLLFKQLRLMVVESLAAPGMCPGMDSSSGYHCATGLLGLSSISSQWSRPIPMKLDPIAVHPISSFDPILHQ